MEKTTEPVKRHRPLVSVTIDPDLLERMEDFRYGNRIPTRSAAFERILSLGLECQEAVTSG